MSETPRIRPYMLTDAQARTLLRHAEAEQSHARKWIEEEERDRTLGWEERRQKAKTLAGEWGDLRYRIRRSLEPEHFEHLPPLQPTLEGAKVGG